LTRTATHLRAFPVFQHYARGLSPSHGNGLPLEANAELRKLRRGSSDKRAKSRMGSGFAASCSACKASRFFAPAHAAPGNPIVKQGRDFFQQLTCALIDCWPERYVSVPLAYLPGALSSSFLPIKCQALAFCLTLNAPPWRRLTFLDGFPCGPLVCRHAALCQVIATCFPKPNNDLP